jgi:hypothetical protein
MVGPLERFYLSCADLCRAIGDDRGCESYLFMADYYSGCESVF